MMIRSTAFLLAIAFSCQPAFSQSKTRDGAVLGGIGGAVVGGIIGHQNDETPEGALIGGAVGAIAGGLLGNARDKQIQQQQYYQHQAWRSQQALRQAQQVQARRGVTMSDVISMSRSGLSDSVILSHIQSNGIQRRLETTEIISLHQSGVSDTVINSMQHAPICSAPQTVYQPPFVVRQPGTVIVHETYSVPTPPPVYAPHPTYYQSFQHHHHHRF